MVRAQDFLARSRARLRSKQHLALTRRYNEANPMENRDCDSAKLGLWVLDISLITAVCLLLFFPGINDTPVDTRPLHVEPAG